MVPVVIATGTTLAIQNLPYVSSPDRAAGSTPSTTATAPPNDEKASKSPTEKQKKNGERKDRKDKSSPSNDKAGGDDAPADDSTRDTKSPPENDDKGNPPDSNPDTDTDTDSPNTDTGGSDNDGDNGDTPTTPTSGPFRLKNADNDACLTQVYGAADDGACGDPSATWKTVSAENNSFKVVNKQSGSCLVANMLGQAVFVGDCTQGSARLWRWGANGTLKSTSNGGCLDLSYGGGVSATTCQSGKASQQWSR
ncbi:RICIN domain-containing protein [Streptomyces sp. G5(2025)]|uniref:RICIN domain-containing protein n=1 Tax=Streptomyces sp. G5(2025) TaxID=3406628 RepID=UPI003C28672B